MTIQVQISDKNKREIISAIRLLKGVREARESAESKSEKLPQKLPVETKADYKAWKKARKELERGETYSLESVKKELGL